jgi:hypothetical protein
VREEGDINYLDLGAKSLGGLLEKVPEARQIMVGHLALLELARIHIGRKDFTKALAVAQEISDLAAKSGEPWARSTGVQADRLIGEIISEASRMGIPVRRNPDLLSRAAEGKVSQRDYIGAVQAYQQVIEACRGDESRLEQKLDAWLKLASCFYRAEGDRYYEAAAAVRHIIETHPDHTKAGDAAYYRYIYLLAQYRFSKDATDLQAYQAAREFFINRYSGHEKAKDLAYFEAVESLEKGKEELAQKRVAEGKTLLAEAERQFRTVDNRSALFELAQARLGQVYYELGVVDRSADDKALEVLAAYLKNSDKSNRDPTWFTTDPARLEKRSQARARAGYYIAKVHERRERWNDILEELRNFLIEHKDQPGWHPQVLFMILNAYLQQDLIADAEKAGRVLHKSFQETVSTSRGLYALARYFDDRQRNLPDGGEKDAALRKAAEYYKLWLNLRPVESQDPRFVKTVGQMYFVLGDMEQAKVYLERAIKKIDPKVTGPKNEANVVFQLAQVYMSQNEPKNALPWLEKLSAANGDDPESVKAMKKMLERRPNEVRIAELQDLLSPDLRYLRELIRAYGQLGEYYAAINLCRRLWRGVGDQSPEWYWARYMYTLMWYEFGRQEKSIDALRNAKETIQNLDNLGLLGRMQDEELKKKYRRLQNEIEKAILALK